jgi:XTP/dITP diphosphohydrolase
MMHTRLHTLVVGTTNRGKVEEIRGLLAKLPLRVITVDEVLTQGVHVNEDGETLRENSLKKARAVASATRMLSLADDSGLEVDSLGGAPGVRSARFAGERATDAENNAALLKAITQIRESSIPMTGEHAARFRCVLTLIDPFFNHGEPMFAEGTCEGAVTRAPRGSGGFGYDPLFIVAGGRRTLAELSPAEKNAVSHRARAVEALKPHLERVLAARDEQIARIG